MIARSRIGRWASSRPGFDPTNRRRGCRARSRRPRARARSGHDVLVNLAEIGCPARVRPGSSPREAAGCGRISPVLGKRVGAPPSYSFATHQRGGEGNGVDEIRFEPTIDESDATSAATARCGAASGIVVEVDGCIVIATCVTAGGGSAPSPIRARASTTGCGGVVRWSGPARRHRTMVRRDASVPPTAWELPSVVVPGSPEAP